MSCSRDFASNQRLTYKDPTCNQDRHSACSPICNYADFDGGNKRLKRVAVLGSTGSIGLQTLDVARQHPDEVCIVALAAGTNSVKLLEQARVWGVSHVALADESRAAQASTIAPAGVSVGAGSDAVVDLVRLDDVDIVVNALVGAAGLRASYEALVAGKVLALANKESLVVGGDLIMPLAAALDKQRVASGEVAGGALMPIDSEHGAIYQCLVGEDTREVTRLWVTASGGPFRGKTRAELAHVTPADALKHPAWNMGTKITVDSSTLMNKGLEVIEAHHLFSMPYERIEVVVHPQSAIHSMVEFSDGSVKAHLGTTDMRIPIQYALSYPKRWRAPVEPLDFRTLGSLDFAAPDTTSFRCLALAQAAGMQGGTLPCVMNAANEVAVAAFLAEEIAFLGIEACVEAAMNKHMAGECGGCVAVQSIEQLSEVDTWARRIACAWLVSHSQ